MQESNSQSCSIAGGGAGDKYVACITSYDYDAPISEAGDYGQPGIGGPNRYQVKLPLFNADVPSQSSVVK